MENRIGQRAAVWQPRLQGFFFKSRDQKPILTPGHPQANKQTEMINRTLLKIIKARLDNAKEAWPKELPNVLWAYKTTARTPIGEAPFRLTYGIEAIILVKVGIIRIKWRRYTKKTTTIN